MSQEPLGKQVQDLLQLRTGDLQTLIVKLKEADSDTLYALIARTGSTGTTGAEEQALREAAIAILRARSTESLVTTMNQLERAATRLTWVGILIAVLGVLVGVAQILVKS